MGSAPDEVASLVRSNRKANGAIRQDEIPRHRVSLEAFYIDKYEVTNARFQQFVQATGYRTQAEREGGARYALGRRRGSMFLTPIGARRGGRGVALPGWRHIRSCK